MLPSHPILLPQSSPLRNQFLWTSLALPVPTRRQIYTQVCMINTLSHSCVKLKTLLDISSLQTWNRVNCVGNSRSSECRRGRLSRGTWRRQRQWCAKVDDRIVMNARALGPGLWATCGALSLSRRTKAAEETPTMLPRLEPASSDRYLLGEEEERG